MKYNSFDKIFKKFLTKYEDLICEYESSNQEAIEETELGMLTDVKPIQP